MPAAKQTPASDILVDELGRPPTPHHRFGLPFEAHFRKSGDMLWKCGPTTGCTRAAQRTETFDGRIPQLR